VTTTVRTTLNTQLAAQVAHSPAVAVELERLTARVAAAADQTCPVGEEASNERQPGHLKDSQRHGVVPTSDGWVGVVGYLAFYASFVYAGTVHNRPNAWLLNAMLNVLQGAL
jgi:hypothetical protein